MIYKKYLIPKENGFELYIWARVNFVYGETIRREDTIALGYDGKAVNN